MKKKLLKNVNIDDLTPYQREIHRTEKSVHRIARSLEKHGYVKISVVVDERLEIICGQGVIKAMQSLEWETVPEVTQVLGMPEAIKRAYRIADDQSGCDSRWDIKNLLEEIDEIKILDPEIKDSDLAFEERELEQMKHDIDEEIEGEEDNFDPSTIRETDIHQGDVFRLGKHRLMCGDATNLQDLQQLMDGSKAHMVFTDPPYNVDYTGGTKKALKIINDKMTAPEFYKFLLRAYQCMYAVCVEGAPIYVCHSDSETLSFRQALVAAHWELKQCIIWVKDQFVLGRQDYHWRHEPILEGCKGKDHEPILYGWKGGKAHRWFGGRDKDTVWEVPKPLRNAEHPTMKPIPLVVRAVQNSSVKDNTVLDPFAGLGSTLMACEQTGRICCTGELDPHYCQGIIDRWEQFTGRTAQQVHA